MSFSVSGTGFGTGQGNAGCSFCDPNVVSCTATSAGICKGGYASIDNGVTCVACEAGKFKVAAGNNVEDCVLCHSGTYAAVAATTCTSCPADKYSENGASVCSDEIAMVTVTVVQEITTSTLASDFLDVTFDAMMKFKAGVANGLAIPGLTYDMIKIKNAVNTARRHRRALTNTHLVVTYVLNILKQYNPSTQNAIFNAFLANINTKLASSAYSTALMNSLNTASTTSGSMVVNGITTTVLTSQNLVSTNLTPTAAPTAAPTTAPTTNEIIPGLSNTGFGVIFGILGFVIVMAAGWYWYRIKGNTRSGDFKQVSQQSNSSVNDDSSLEFSVVMKE